MTFHSKDAGVDHSSQAEIEELWFIEAKRRLDELHSGKVEGIDADEAFNSIRELLARTVKNRLREDPPVL
jgi:Putative addiction module component